MVQRATLNGNNTVKSPCLACGVCSAPGSSGVVLKNCLHNVCVKCLQASIRKEVVNVKCPAHVKTGCVGILTTEELNQLITPHEMNLLVKKRNSFDVAVARRNAELYKFPESEYKVLRRLDDFSRVPNVEEFICSLCSQLIVPLKGIVLRECLHAFCTQCLLKHIDETGNIAVKCPFRNDSYACEELVQQRDMRAILSETKFNDLVEKSLIVQQQTVPESADAFCCGNCLNICDPDAGFALISCEHTFCRCCLIGTITSSKTGIVICYFDDCTGLLSDEEVRSLLNADQIRAYDKTLVI